MMLLLRLLALAGMIWAPFLAAQTVPVGQGPQQLRYLFIVDVASSMEGYRSAVADQVRAKVLNAFDGQARPGDLFGVWTFNGNVVADCYLPMPWYPQTSALLAERLCKSLRNISFHGEAKFDKAVAELSKLAVVVDSLTVWVLSDGAHDVRGTPFDDKIAAAYRELRSVPGAPPNLLLTTFLVRDGGIAGWSIDRTGALPSPGASTASVSSPPARTSSANAPLTSNSSALPAKSVEVHAPAQLPALKPVTRSVPVPSASFIAADLLADLPPDTFGNDGLSCETLADAGGTARTNGPGPKPEAAKPTASTPAPVGVSRSAKDPVAALGVCDSTFQVAPVQWFDWPRPPRDLKISSAAPAPGAITKPVPEIAKTAPKAATHPPFVPAAAAVAPVQPVSEPTRPVASLVQTPRETPPRNAPAVHDSPKTPPPRSEPQPLMAGFGFGPTSFLVIGLVLLGLAVVALAKLANSSRKDPQASLISQSVQVKRRPAAVTPSPESNSAVARS